MNFSSHPCPFTFLQCDFAGGIPPRFHREMESISPPFKSSLLLANGTLVSIWQTETWKELSFLLSAAGNPSQALQTFYRMTALQKQAPATATFGWESWSPVRLVRLPSDSPRWASPAQENRPTHAENREQRPTLFQASRFWGWFVLRQKSTDTQGWTPS